MGEPLPTSRPDGKQWELIRLVKILADMRPPFPYHDFVSIHRLHITNCGVSQTLIWAREKSIRAQLIQAYPHRREIFDAAFDAHLSGQYLVSIPVLLAQVDGICFDVVNAHFFMRSQRPKVLAHAVEFAGSQIARAFLAPLESEMTINLSEKARLQGFTGLNRHMVLHGESVDYGTKENGLRAISLLNYMSQSLQRELFEPDDDATGADQARSSSTDP